MVNRYLDTGYQYSFTRAGPYLVGICVAYYHNYT